MILKISNFIYMENKNLSLIILIFIFFYLFRDSIKSSFKKENFSSLQSSLKATLELISQSLTELKTKIPERASTKTCKNFVTEPTIESCKKFLPKNTPASTASCPRPTKKLCNQLYPNTNEIKISAEEAVETEENVETEETDDIKETFSEIKFNLLNANYNRDGKKLTCISKVGDLNNTQIKIFKYLDEIYFKDWYYTERFAGVINKYRTREARTSALESDKQYKFATELKEKIKRELSVAISKICAPEEEAKSFLEKISSGYFRKPEPSLFDSDLTFLKRSILNRVKNTYPNCIGSFENFDDLDEEQIVFLTELNNAYFKMAISKNDEIAIQFKYNEISDNRERMNKFINDPDSQKIFASQHKIRTNLISLVENFCKDKN